MSNFKRPTFRKVFYSLYITVTDSKGNLSYEKVKDIYSKSHKTASTNFMKYATKHGYTRCVHDETLSGGYYVMPSTGETLHLIPSHMTPEQMYA